MPIKFHTTDELLRGHCHQIVAETLKRRRDTRMGSGHFVSHINLKNIHCIYFNTVTYVSKEYFLIIFMHFAVVPKSERMGCIRPAMHHIACAFSRATSMEFGLIKLKFVGMVFICNSCTPSRDNQKSQNVNQ